MQIRDLRLRWFRNYDERVFHFDSPSVLLVGQNGSGKTNVLEALSVLAVGKSFRSGVQIRDLVHWQKPDSLPTSVEGSIQTRDGLKQVRFQIENGRRSFFVNDNRQKSLSDFYGVVRVVDFSPDDLFLIKGPPADRRDAFDRIFTMTIPLYGLSLTNYEKALQERNALLREVKHHPISERELNAQLSQWESILINEGLKLAAIRREELTKLSPLFSKFYAHLADHAGEQAALNYETIFIDQSGNIISELAAEKLFAESRLGDRSAVRTAIGIHRDDYEFLLDVGQGLRSAKGNASQGQTRSLVLALKFAFIEYIREKTKEDPVLLLDDIESELDEKRKKALFELVEALDTQLFLTHPELSEIGKNSIKTDPGNSQKGLQLIEL
ncbi:DNA replication and repair protein RecF [bacterium]|nr:DNA replication and repair protein RecF [bacterium]